jgi:outer membrane lipoprotein LolB
MLRIAVQALVVVLLAACTTLAPPREAERVHQGRFAVTASWPDRTENTSGRFSLSVHGDGLTLDLASPLGNTLARIDTDANGARMTAPAANGSMHQLQGPSADALAEQVLGWSLPVSGIGDWIIGRPVPARTYRSMPDSTTIEQDGWMIRVLDRFEGNGVPRRLTFERAAAAPSPAVTVRLVLDDPTS